MSRIAKACAWAVVNRTRFRTWAGMALLTALVWSGMVRAQELPAPPPQPPPAAVPFQEESTKNVAAPCVQPPPLVRLEDYDGPLKKIVARSPGRWNASRCTS